MRWKQFVDWCRVHKYSATRPSTDTICKFLIHLWEDRKLAVGTIRGFRSMLHSVLRHNKIDIKNNQDIAEVIKSFVLEKPPKKKSIAWNVDVVLKYLASDRFEPLDKISMRDLTKKTVFLLALALAKRVSELQALSKEVGFSGEGALVSLIMSFRAKNDNKFKRLPRSFLVKGLTQLVGPEEERKLCPVRALRAYLARTKEFRQEQVENLFLAVKDPSRPASKNALAYFIKSTILEAYQNVSETTMKLCRVTPHEVRAVATSLAFTHNLALETVLEAAQWRSNSVFTGHYLKEVALQYQNCKALGPIVAGGSIIQ